MIALHDIILYLRTGFIDGDFRALKKNSIFLTIRVIRSIDRSNILLVGNAIRKKNVRGR